MSKSTHGSKNRCRKITYTYEVLSEFQETFQEFIKNVKDKFDETNTINSELEEIINQQNTKLDQQDKKI